MLRGVVAVAWKPDGRGAAVDGAGRMPALGEGGPEIGAAGAAGVAQGEPKPAVVLAPLCCCLQAYSCWHPHAGESAAAWSCCPLCGRAVEGSCCYSHACELCCWQPQRTPTGEMPRASLASWTAKVLAGQGRLAAARAGRRRTRHGRRGVCRRAIAGAACCCSRVAKVDGVAAASLVCGGSPGPRPGSCWRRMR